MPTSRLRLALFYAVATLLPTLAFSQPLPATNNAKPCDSSMVFVHDLQKIGGGWDISLIDTSQVLSKELALNTTDPAYLGVTNVQLGLKKNIFYFTTVRFSPCSRDATIEESRMFVIRAFAFKKGDRVFAYRYSGSVQKLEDGQWQSCMCGGEIVVYDPDGTGKFSHLVLYSSLLPYVPEWARDHASTENK